MSQRSRSPSAPDAPQVDLQRFRDALARVPERQGGSERLLRVLIRAWCRLCGWRLTLTGQDRLPAHPGRPPGSGCIVVVAPHRAWVEPFLLAAAWPPDAARLVWLADARTVTRSAWRRRLLPRLGVLPVISTGQGPRDHAAAAAAVLERGAALVVFPEKGPPSPPDRTRRISPGFAYLARRAGAPIVPVVVGGTHRIVRDASFSIDLLEAIDPGPADDDPFRAPSRPLAHALARRFESQVAAVLPQRTAEADARRPARERWRWLATLLE